MILILNETDISSMGKKKAVKDLIVTDFWRVSFGLIWRCEEVRFEKDGKVKHFKNRNGELLNGF